VFYFVSVAKAWAAADMTERIVLNSTLILALRVLPRQPGVPGWNSVPLAPVDIAKAKPAGRILVISVLPAALCYVLR